MPRGHFERLLSRRVVPLLLVLVEHPVSMLDAAAVLVATHQLILELGVFQQPEDKRGEAVEQEGGEPKNERCKQVNHVEAGQSILERVEAHVPERDRDLAAFPEPRNLDALDRVDLPHETPHVKEASGCVEQREDGDHRDDTSDHCRSASCLHCHEFLQWSRAMNIKDFDIIANLLIFVNMYIAIGKRAKVTISRHLNIGFLAKNYILPEIFASRNSLTSLM